MDFLLIKRGINNDKQALLALLTWCKSHELDMFEGTSLDSSNWEQAGRNILAAASIGDDTAMDVKRPWKIILIKTIE